MNRFTLHSVCAVAIAAALGACKTTSPTASAVKEGGGRPVGEFIGGPSIVTVRPGACDGSGVVTIFTLGIRGVTCAISTRAAC